MKMNKLIGASRRRGWFWLAVSITLIGFALIACSPPEPGENAVVFSDLTANGTANAVTTTQLTLTFDKAIDGLSVADITLSGVNGVTKGSLNGTNAPAYTLGISGATSGGTLTVAVAKDGYAISPSSRQVTIHHSGGTPNPSYPNLGADILSLPPMYLQFEDNFLIGNIFNTSDALRDTEINTKALTRHFNVLTAENAMKPRYIATGRNSSTGDITYSYDTADRMVNAALASGMKVVGHTLLWHQQNATWMSTTGSGQLQAHDNDDSKKAANLVIMRKYITEVVDHFKGRIYSWDVLNEAFPDGLSASADWKVSIRSTGNEPNPWYLAIGPDFVYEAFLAARKADPDTILYYNDFNLNQVGKATMVRDMVRDVNKKYEDEGYPGETVPGTARLLIEGIGMQSHHNVDITRTAIKNTLDLFRPLGVIISISELDVLAQSWGSHSSNSIPTQQGLTTQARLYGEYMALFVENDDIIERVSLWGVTDNQSWRAVSLPLLFDKDGKAKMAYDTFVALGKEVTNPPPDEQPISLTPVKFGDANKDALKVEIDLNTDVVTITATDTGGWIGFYYALPSNWNTYSTIELDYTATVNSGLAKLTLKKGRGANDDLNETPKTSNTYKDVYTGSAYPTTVTDTWTWSTSLFAGMAQPGITFQINNYASTDLPHNGWTFKATDIRLIP